jgi:hypothetical protein
MGEGREIDFGLDIGINCPNPNLLPDDNWITSFYVFFLFFIAQ